MEKTPSVLEARPATIDDIELLARIHARSLRASGEMSAAYLDRLDGPEQPARWTARVPNVVLVDRAGFAWFGPAEEDATLGEIYLIAVDPDHWRAGVGTTLLDAAVERLRAAGFTDAIVWTGVTNGAARRAYEAHGWRADGATKSETYAGTKYPELRYRRSL